ncbi:MAG TPA: hypothetical protein VJS69_09485 [Candidatus Krumholzibacteria bacterium]|nr:hypothetical protein [Candidatus Krumholzibacteria bacterium]
MKTAIAVVLLLLALPGALHADAFYPDAIKFGPSYAIAAATGFPFFFPAFGSPLFIAGTVTNVAAPFNDLLPAGSYELTWVASGATCNGYGNWDDFDCNRDGVDVGFAGGTISFFLDTTPDADFTNPSTFQDGELVLQAQTQAIHITNDDPDGYCVTDNRPDVFMSFSFIGGSWLHRVAPGSLSYGRGEIPGSYPDMIPAPLRALGYVLRIDGTINVTGPVATEPVTWGHVKSLYRD